MAHGDPADSGAGGGEPRLAFGEERRGEPAAARRRRDVELVDVVAAGDAEAERIARRAGDAERVAEAAQAVEEARGGAERGEGGRDEAVVGVVPAGLPEPGEGRELVGRGLARRGHAALPPTVRPPITPEPAGMHVSDTLSDADRICPGSR